MRLIGAALLVLALAGCTTETPTSIPESIDLAPSSSQQADADLAEPGNPEPTTVPDSSAEPVPAEGEASQVIDDSELEIDDQVGDGSSVQIAEIETNLASGLIVIFSSSGEVLGSAKASYSVRPVTIELSTPVTSDSELIAKFYADNGNGVFDSADLEVFQRDDDGLDAVEEDFEYEVR